MSRERAIANKELQYTYTLREFFTQYAITLDKYLTEYKNKKIDILEYTVGVGSENYGVRLLSEIIGLPQYQAVAPTSEGDNFVITDNIDDNTLTQRVTSIEDSDLIMDIDLDDYGNDLHSAVLNRVVGQMNGADLHEGTSRRFNFSALKVEFPELYDALVWGHKNNIWSLESELTHLGFGQAGDSIYDFYDMASIDELLDKPSVTGRIPEYDLFRGLLLDKYSSGDSINSKLVPAFTFKLNISEEFLQELDDVSSMEISKLLDKSAKELGGLPGGKVVGDIDISQSLHSALDNRSLKYFFGNMLNLTEDQWDRLPDIDDDEVNLVAERLGLPDSNVEGNMLHIDWNFVQAGSADGFANLYNEPELSGSANPAHNLVKNKTLQDFMDFTQKTIQHFKAQNVAFESTVSVGMPQLVNLYQGLGAMVLPKNSLVKTKHIGTGIGGGDMLPVLILPEYMDNKDLFKKVLRIKNKNSIFNQEVKELSSDFTYVLSNGEAIVLNKGSIITNNQFSYLQQMARNQGLEKPVAKKLGKFNDRIAKAFFNERFGTMNPIYVRNVLNRKEYLANSIINPSPGFELFEFEYKAWDDYQSTKPTIYTDFYKKLSLAMRSLKIEDVFLTNLIKVIFDGEFIDNEQRVIAIPLVSDEGFTFLNTSNMTPDEMWNIVYMTSGNKNFTPDIYFGGKIGNVEYTEELRKEIRDVMKFGFDKKARLSMIDKYVTPLQAPPPIGMAEDGLTTGPATVFKLYDMLKKSPKVALKLFQELDTAVFTNLPPNVYNDLETLSQKLKANSISIDDIPDDVDLSTLLLPENQDAWRNAMDNLIKKLEDIEVTFDEGAGRARALGRAAGVRPRRDNLTPLIEIIEDTETEATLGNNLMPEGENAIRDSAFTVDAVTEFFDLSQNSDYELLVTGLAQGPSHYHGKNIDETKSSLANLIQNNPEYRLYAFKFLERFDGTTVIPFVAEEVKDIFKKNLLIANRMIPAGSIYGDMQDMANIIEGTTTMERVLDKPKMRVTHFDVSPVSNKVLEKNNIHMLEFDIGIADGMGGTNNKIFRTYTQIAYSYDDETGEIRIHHIVDNLPNDSNTRMGSSVRQMGNISNHYAIKDSAIIKSLMEIHDVTDDKKVITGDAFLPLSTGVTSVGNNHYPTYKIIPGRIAYAMGLVESIDTDPDAAMYTKTLGQTQAPLLRYRNVESVLGFTYNFRFGIVDSFSDAEDALLDSGQKLTPITNNANFYSIPVTHDSIQGEDITKFVTNFGMELEAFKLKQDNISGVTLDNVVFTLKDDTGSTIKITGKLNHDMTFFQLINISSDLDTDQLDNVLSETIKNNYNLDNFDDLSEGEIEFLRKNYLLFPELDTNTGQYNFSTMGNDVVGNYKVSEISFNGSTLAVYGDTETALEVNEVMKNNGFQYVGDGLTHTYNPFVTKIMTSNSSMNYSTPVATESGVGMYDIFDYNENFRMYMDNMYGQSKSHNGNTPFINSNRKWYPRQDRFPGFIDDAFTFVRTDDTTQNNVYENGLLRHKPVLPTDIARVGRLSGAAFKSVLKPVGGAFRILEKFDIADKIVMKSIKPASSAIAKGVSKIGGKTAIAALGGAAAATTIGTGLAAVYAVTELLSLATGLIKEGDLFSDTQKLMKELRDDNPGDGAWKRFWVSTGKNAWKGLEWQQDHSLSGWVEKQISSAAGQAFNTIQQQRLQNRDLVMEIANYAENNEDVFYRVNNYDPQYNDQFDSINTHFQQSQLDYGTESYKDSVGKQLNQITSYPLWKNTEELLYNGNEEYLATVDNYIKLANAYEGIGY